MKRTFLLLLSGLLWVSCERKTAADVYDKDPYDDVYRKDPAENDSTLKANNTEITLRPLRVIFTGYPQYALLPMLKVRYDDDGTPLGYLYCKLIFTFNYIFCQIKLRRSEAVLTVTYIMTV